MDILLQFLSIRKQKQVFVKVTGIDCNTIYQAINHKRMDDRAVTFIDYMEESYKSSFLFVGIIDAQYCNRKVIEELSYSDFCRITCGPGETSGID
jgi:hypothetical protein